VEYPDKEGGKMYCAFHYIKPPCNFSFVYIYDHIMILFKFIHVT